MRGVLGERRRRWWIAWGVEHRSCRRARAARFPRLTPRTARVTSGRTAGGPWASRVSPARRVTMSRRPGAASTTSLSSLRPGQWASRPVLFRALAGQRACPRPSTGPQAPSGGSVGFYGRYRAARNATLAAFTTIPAKCRVVAPSCIAAVCHGRPGHRPVRSFRGGGGLRRGQGVGRCVHLAALDGRGLSRGVVRFVDSIIHDGDIIDLSALVLVH